MSARNAKQGPRVNASPRARQAMQAAGIDPAKVRGSGPGGRIVVADVAGAAAVDSPAPQFSDRLSPMRRAVARATTASAAIPQFRLHAELDARPMVQARALLLTLVQQETRARLSFTDFLLLAMGLALVDNPAANAIWLDGDIVRLPDANVGLLVSLDDGLLLSTLTGLDRVELGELAKRRAAAVASARSGHVGSSSLRSATSLSNLGTTRVDDFSAVVFPPQSSILAAGRITERPWAAGGHLVVAPTLRLTLTVDHRVLDGAPAAQFLGRIVHYLEEPDRMLTGRVASKV